MRDCDVRSAVKAWLSTEHARDEDTRLVEEMGVWSGSVRIDIAIINGSLNGYELKSDRDTLGRLPRQAKLYGHVFDYLSLVVGIRHAEDAKRILPGWWGIMLAICREEGIELISHRHAEPNPAPNAYLIAELLSKEEAIGILQNFGLDKGWRSKRIQLIHERLSKELALCDLRDQVRKALKQRPRSVKVCQSERELCDG